MKRLSSAKKRAAIFERDKRKFKLKKKTNKVTKKKERHYGSTAIFLMLLLLEFPYGTKEHLHARNTLRFGYANEEK